MTFQLNQPYKEKEVAASGTKKALGASRISWVDHARGIAIMLVVYRHVVVGLRRAGIAVSNHLYDVQEVFYNFRMPVFFVLSGIFLANSLRKRSRVKVLKDRAFTILWPYLVWGVIMITLELLFSRYTNSKRHWSDLLNILIQPRGVDQLWYLFALFNTSMLYLLFNRLLGGKDWLHALLAIALHGATFTSFLQGNSLVSDAFYFYPYFFLGTYLSPVLLNKEKSDALLKAAHLLWVLPLFVLCQWFWFEHRSQEDSYFLLFLLINLVACYFVYIISHIVSLNSRNDWLAYLGKYSLYIYILHVPVAAVIRNLFVHFYPGASVYLIIPTIWVGGLLIPVLVYNSLKNHGFGKLFSLKPKTAA